MALAPDGRFIIADMVREQVGPMGAARLMKSTAAQDKANHSQVRGSCLQDPGQAGKAQAQHLMRHVLSGFDYHFRKRIEPCPSLRRPRRAMCSYWKARGMRRFSTRSLASRWANGKTMLTRHRAPSPS